MSVKEYVFDGKADWVRKEPTTFKDGSKKYTMAFYPDTVNTRKALQATGIQNKVKLHDETGEAFFTLRSDEAYTIIDADGKPVEALVGNGSAVKIKLAVETFKRSNGDTGARSKLLEVMVTKLVPYEKPDVSATVAGGVTAPAELPA